MGKSTPQVQAASADRAGDLVLATQQIRMVLDSGKGYGIRLLSDPVTGHEFASAHGSPGLYRLTLVGLENAAKNVTSADAKVTSKSASEDVIQLTFHHEAERLRCFCSVRLDGRGPRLAWKIRIENEGHYAIRSIFYPLWIAPIRLSADGKTDRILYPFLDGHEFAEPGRHFAVQTGGDTPSPSWPPIGWRAQYPGQACIQMMAYHDGRSGLLEMTRDGEGWIKHFQVNRIKEGFDLSIEHNPDETPGENIDLPYETCFEIFHGEWQEAADIYKAWGAQQKWARRTVEDRGLPSFLASGSPILSYLLRGDAYSAEWSMYFPPSNRLINPDFHPSKISALTNAYGSFLGTKIISNPFGWEHIAPWIAGNYFPPVCGEETWRQTADALRTDGHKLFMLLSGSRWGVMMDDVGYDEYDHFMQTLAPQAAAYGPDGRPMEEWPPWAGSVDLCIGTPFTQRHLREAFLGCVQRGASVVQYDQNHGGMAFPCYKRDHPHPVGYGRWMVQRAEEMYAAIIAEAKKVNPDFVLAVEEPCEYFMPYFDLYMGRPYNFFGTGSIPTAYRRSVPLFIYVYHEYHLGYGGSNEIDIAHPYAEAIKIARKFTNGTLLEVDPGKPAFRLDTIPSPTEELQLARSCTLAITSYACKYLLFGKRLPDPEAPGLPHESVRMWRSAFDQRYPFDMPVFEVPHVLESTWEHKGNVAYIFANWQTTEQEVVFRPKPYGQAGNNFQLVSYCASESGASSFQQTGPLPSDIHVQVPALSALMVEQSAISNAG
jgi:Domain of unknown function (DUF6259)